MSVYLLTDLTNLTYFTIIFHIIDRTENIDKICDKIIVFFNINEKV